jgi:hypothetical protein
VIELPTVYVNIILKLVFTVLTLILMLLLNRGMRHLLRLRIAVVSL